MPLALGFSLIEVILFILIISIGVLAIVKAFEIASIGSADPVLRRQSLAIAQGLMEEIRTQSFSNPSGGYTCSSATPCNASTRKLFDNVMDYNGLTLTGITDLSGNAVAGLSGYNSRVCVAAAAFGGVPSTAGYKISVVVTGPGCTTAIPASCVSACDARYTVTLEGYRANY